MSLQRQNAESTGGNNRLAAIIDAQFAVDIDAVFFDRIGGNKQPLSDLLVAAVETLSKEASKN